jgi:hypothetical protein
MSVIEAAGLILIIANAVYHNKAEIMAVNIDFNSEIVSDVVTNRSDLPDTSNLLLLKFNY